MAVGVLGLYVSCKSIFLPMLDFLSLNSPSSSGYISQAGLCLFIIVFFLPETYEPIILARKAARKRQETGDTRYFAAIEHHKVSLTRRAKDTLSKPFLVFVNEPMLIAITVYMAVGRFFWCA